MLSLLGGAVLTVALGLQPPPNTSEPQDTQPQTQQPPQKVDDSEAKKPPTPERTGIRALIGNLGGDFTHLPHLDNLFVAVLGGGLALGAHPFDDGFNVRLRSHYDGVNRAFAPGKYLAGHSELSPIE